jgi:two-component system chemotaxis sensor kinase CheA
LKVRFSLASIDTALEDLKARAKPVAEIITYLPSMGETDAESIDLDVLLASRVTLDRLREVLGSGDAELTAVPRRDPARAPKPPPVPWATRSRCGRSPTRCASTSASSTI